MAKYLDYDGLGKVWAKIDLLFARKTQLASVYKVKGSCTTANLPTNAVEGDVWNLTDAGTYGPAGTNVVWVAATGSETAGHWDSLGAPIQTATTSNDGLMTAAMVTKLNGIATGANKYTHPSYTAQTSGLYKITVDATGHVSAATAVAKADITGLGIPGSDTNTTYTFTNGTNGFTVTPSGGTAQTVTVTPSITNNALTTSTVSGTVTGSTTGTAGVGGTVGAPSITITKATVTNALGYTPPTTNTTYSDFTGASSSAAGTHGLVPAPAAGANTKFLRGDGTWQVVADTAITEDEINTICV